MYLKLKQLEVMSCLSADITYSLWQRHKWIKRTQVYDLSTKFKEKECAKKLSNQDK